MQRRRELLLQVDARARAPRRRAAQDAVLVEQIAAEVVARLLVAAFDGEVLLGARRRASEDVVLVVEARDRSPAASNGYRLNGCCSRSSLDAKRLSQREARLARACRAS